ncbi:hypothetical protein [Brevibacillus laterosporus]|uniref:hypothetical protein n=1 Tax=Brevibacillus laterosporus TaxID=1465 RepID=UPI003D1B6C56
MSILENNFNDLAVLKGRVDVKIIMKRLEFKIPTSLLDISSKKVINIFEKNYGSLTEKFTEGRFLNALPP